MFYQGVKTCVLTQKCATQIKNQTRLRKVLLNVINTAWIFFEMIVWSHGYLFY